MHKLNNHIYDVNSNHVINIIKVNINEKKEKFLFYFYTLLIIICLLSKSY